MGRGRENVSRHYSETAAIPAADIELLHTLWIYLLMFSLCAYMITYYTIMLLIFIANYVYITVVLIFIIIVITWARETLCCNRIFAGARINGIPENRPRKYFRIFSLRS
jgi:hypothetical protein